MDGHRLTMSILQHNKNNNQHLYDDGNVTVATCVTVNTNPWGIMWRIQ